MRRVGGQWQPVPGISGVGTDDVLRYAAPTPRSSPWALFAQGRDRNHQNVARHTG